MCDEQISPYLSTGFTGLLPDARVHWSFILGRGDDGDCVRETGVFVGFLSQPDSCMNFDLDYQGVPHPFLSESSLVGTSPQYLPRKAACRSL